MGGASLLQYVFDEFITVRLDLTAVSGASFEMGRL